jgi:hypothetical protein
MTSLYKNNIKLAQSTVKEKIHTLLSLNGYILVREERGEHNWELIQWSNSSLNHSFQIIWDTREQWFDMGEFHRTTKLNHVESQGILIVPINVIRLFFRKRYANKIADKILLSLTPKLKAITNHVP